MASIREQSLNLQHDLNCLTIAGADRFKRRQAVLQLRAKLASMQVIGRLDQASDDSRDELILELLSKPLIITLNDPAESCRSAALDLLRELIPSKAERMLDDFLSIVVDRFVGGQESSEELRLSLVEFLGDLLLKIDVSSLSERENDSIIRLLSHALIDPFPDLKSKSSLIIAQLADSNSSLDFTHLLTNLMVNLKHQRHKVRLDSLKAITAIIQASSRNSSKLPSWYIEQILPAFCNLTCDRSPSVRMALADQAMNVITSFDIPRGNVLAGLFMIVLSAMSDDGPENRKTASEKFSKLSPLHSGEGNDSGDARDLLAENLFDLLKCQLLPLISAWTSSKRMNASRILQTVIQLVQDRITAYVPKILPCIIRALDDDDVDNVHNLCQCAFELGRYADPDAAIQVLYTGLAQSAANLDESVLVKHLVVLRHVLRGVATKQIDFASDFIASILSLDAIYSSSNRQLQSECLQFLETCIESIPSSCTSFQFSFFFALLQTISIAENCTAHKLILQKFLDKLNLRSSADLFSQHFLAVLDRVRSGQELLKSRSVCRLIICLVEHAAPVMNYEQTHAVMMVLASPFSDLDRKGEISDYDAVMEKLIHVMDAIMTIIRAAPVLSVFADMMVTRFFSPCLIWHSGYGAACLRTKTVQCLIASCKRNDVLESCQAALLDQLFIQLISCLDDHDLAVRIHAVELTGLLLQKPDLRLTLPPTLASELLARLDDSSDQVRIMTCVVLIHLYSRHCNIQETLISDICSVAFIHLDDPNPDVQAAIFSVLSHLQQANACKFDEEVQRLQGKHTPTSLYYNQLINRR